MVSSHSRGTSAKCLQGRPPLRLVLADQAGRQQTAHGDPSSSAISLTILNGPRFTTDTRMVPRVILHEILLRPRLSALPTEHALPPPRDQAVHTDKMDEPCVSQTCVTLCEDKDN